MVAIAQASSVTSAAGRRRRARRAQKRGSETRPVSPTSRSSCAVMRKPEITKKTSTPTKPPRSTAGHTWKTTTSSTAIARSAWISGRWLDVDIRAGLPAPTAAYADAEQATVAAACCEEASAYVDVAVIDQPSGGHEAGARKYTRLPLACTGMSICRSVRDSCGGSAKVTG